MAGEMTTPSQRTEKQCRDCGETKPLDQFYRAGHRGDGHGSYCKPCAGKRSLAYAMKNRENYRRYSVKCQYGITAEVYNELLETQNHVCAICGGINENGRRLNVDHDHRCCSKGKACGKCVRGLLCHGCNNGLGAFGDDVDRMLKAIAYVLKHREFYSLEGGLTV